ncbi:MAG: nucleotidyltransferase domain-containing protein [Anaerolineales bacterium]
MKDDRSALRSIITRFCDELSQMGIHVDEVMLYGSQARGTALPDSDIDLIVVSPDWEAYNQRERLEILGVAAARILEPVQANGFTPQEIASRKLLPFWEHILNTEAAPV